MDENVRGGGTNRERQDAPASRAAAEVHREGMEPPEPERGQLEGKDAEFRHVSPRETEMERSELDATGPETDAPLEIDFIRGRFPVSLETFDDAEGPEEDDEGFAFWGPSTGISWERGPLFDESGGDEVGPAFDLEHLPNGIPS